MRRRRWRLVGVAVVCLIGLYVVVDIVTLQYVTNRGGAQIARTMSAEEASISVGSFPFLPGFLRGKLDKVKVLVQGATATGGLRVDKLDAELGSVSFSPGKIFSLARSSLSTRTKVKATQPTARIELREQDLEDYVRHALPVVGDLQVNSSGVFIRFLKPDVELTPTQQPSKEDLTSPARYLPFVRDGRFYLSLLGVSGIEPRYREPASRLEELIKLPKLPDGMSAQVSTSKDVVVIETQGNEVSLVVGEGAG